MKKPVLNYREFRLSNINSPEFYHLKFLMGWVMYFALYLLTENIILAYCFLVEARAQRKSNPNKSLTP